jgi:hypothetical protein
MSKKSEARKAQKLETARLFHEKMECLKKEQSERALRSREKIPGDVAIPDIEEELLQELGSSPFSLIFHFYNKHMCALEKISKALESEQIVAILDKLSKSRPNTFMSSVRDTVHRKQAQNDYLKLFSTVPKDTDSIYEMDFCDTGRVFFFTVTGKQKNFACIVSINPLHLKN